MLCMYICAAQNKLQPVAKFSFNNGKDFDEITGRKIKMSGATKAFDRFNNENSAIYVHGHQYSYINLGNYPALKCKTASISLWVHINNEVWSGKGVYLNPIILTKSCNEDDFFESYAIYYMPETDDVITCITKDSTNQMTIPSVKKFKRYKWHHMVFTYDNNGSAFYIDGEKQGEFAKGFETKFSETDSVLVGVTGNKKNNRFLNAVIDDIEFFDRVLTEDEIDELYNAPNPNKNQVALNWFLIGGSMLLFLIIVFLCIKYYIKITLKKGKQRLELANKLLENELRINRALMNPHFMFNSLNTLHNYILTNNVEKASEYLVKFSKLIRKILDSNMSDTISLDQEIELIHRYLEIEGLRFREHIKHAIVVDPLIVPSAITIPIMMVQPFIENSVWHGLRDKTGDKIITVSFSHFETNYLECIIEDNGTGRKKKEPNSLEKKSLATGFVLQRLELLNKIHKLNCSLTIIDKENMQGTIVKIILPILNK